MSKTLGIPSRTLSRDLSNILAGGSIEARGTPSEESRSRFSARFAAAQHHGDDVDPVLPPGDEIRNRKE